MNPYGMLHSAAAAASVSQAVHDHHNHLSRMLHIPVVHQQIPTPTISNSAMRALGSLSQPPLLNGLMTSATSVNSGQAEQHQHPNRVSLDHSHQRTGSSSSSSSNTTTNQEGSLQHGQQRVTGGNQSVTSQPSSLTTTTTTLELHPDIVLDNFFEDTEDRPHVCTVCNACYKTRTHLKRHMFIHLKARPFTCEFPECGKGFNRKEHLNKHQDAVHRLSKYKCSYCSKEISRKDHLNRHIKNMHTFPLPQGGSRRGQGGGGGGGTGRWSKKKKGKAFPQQQDVKSENTGTANRFPLTNQLGASGGDIQHPHHFQHHQIFPNGKVVGGVGPPPGILELFSCNECSASFVSQNDLTAHSKAHKPQPYKCSECSRAYTRREKLTEHVRCFHQGQKFTCEYCGKDLSRKDHVLRHVRSVHPEVLASQFVEMAEHNGIDPAAVLSARSTSNNSSNGSTSMISSSSSTPTTVSSSNATTTTPAMGEMGALLKSVCHICLKVFGTSYHLSRHVQSVHNQNMRPYSCNYCSKQFKRKDHLSNHMKSHCPSQREASPATSNLGHLPATLNPLDMNNLLNGSESIRQHALNSLQIEMLAGDDDHKSELGDLSVKREKEGGNGSGCGGGGSNHSKKSKEPHHHHHHHDHHSNGDNKGDSHGKSHNHPPNEPNSNPTVWIVTRPVPIENVHLQQQVHPPSMNRS